jgi:hypothetical protein
MTTKTEAKLVMAKTKALYTRKPQANVNEGLPFETGAPKLTRAEAIVMLNAELQKGEDSFNNEPLLTLAQLKSRLKI